MVGTAVTSRISARLGLRGAIAPAGLLVAAGFAALAAALHPTPSRLHRGVFGFGFGVLLAAMAALVAEAAPAGSKGIAAGICNTVRVLGGAVMGGVLSVVLGSTVLAHAEVGGVPVAPESGAEHRTVGEPHGHGAIPLTAETLGPVERDGHGLTDLLGVHGVA